MNGENPKYRREALAALPAGYYGLGNPDNLRSDDLVWSWTSKEFLRADSQLWKFSPLKYSEDIILAARKVASSVFAETVPTRKHYAIKS